MDENGTVRRDYIVLRHNSSAGYASLGTYTATGADQAARQAAKQLDPTDMEQGVQLVAIPARNWTEHTFRLTHQTRIVKS